MTLENTYIKERFRFTKSRAVGMLLLVSLILLNSCYIDLGYKRKDGEWYWTDTQFILYGRRYYPIPEADNKTFKPLSKNYAKDKNNVYYNDKVMDEADPKTFKRIKKNYYKDKNAVYYVGTKVDNADSETFTPLNKVYSKDKNNVFYYKTLIPDSDIKTFKVLSEIYAKDKNTVYYKDSILHRADPSTFSLVGSGISGYAKDKSFVFFHEIPLINADPTTFQSLAEGYAKDKNQVYLDDIIISGADPQTFKVLNEYYAKDKNDVYCGMIPLGLTPSETKEFRISDENTGELRSRSFYSVSEFVKEYPSYSSSLDTTLIKRVIIGKGVAGKTKSRKFIGLREVEP